ncbi:MAG: cadherin-like beta sandwich domain-containing protein [Verrucomicrobiota bacterium]
MHQTFILGRRDQCGLHQENLNSSIGGVMIRRITLCFIAATLLAMVLPALAGTVSANFTSASSIPVTATSYSATGNDVSISLGFAPPTGTNLTVVNNTGLGFITGQFSNLAQGQAVNLTYNGIAYKFVANYYGGTGNDLVLHWAYQDLAAWGRNPAYGQLGNGTTTDSSVPVSVAQSGVLAGKTVVAVSAGYDYSLTLCADGTVAAWGENWFGFGNGSTTSSHVPVLVTQSGVLAGKTVVAVAAGRGHSLALCSDGTVAAWGGNTYGQLGNNSVANSFVPVLVTLSGVLAGKNVIALSAGGWHSLALCSDGTVAAWGYNGHGQLGNGTTIDSSVPVLVTKSGGLAGKTVVSVAAGQFHSLALCSDSTIAAWGRNSNGQLGNNSATNSNVPVSVMKSGVLAGNTVIAVSAGDFHSLALCSDGTVAAWGYNLDGELGNGSTTSSNVPVFVTLSGVLADKTVVAVSVGSQHSLALCSDGTVAAWGYNSGGEIGNGTTANSNVPVLVTQSGVLAGKTVIAVSAGDFHSLALAAVQNSCDLTTMALGSGTLNPQFDPATTSYTAPVPYATTSINVSPTSPANIAAISVNGFAVTSGSKSQEIPLDVGANTVTVLVTAPDGTTTKAYTVTITRLPISSIATLSGLAPSSATLSPAFSASVEDYTARVANTMTSLTVTPTVTDTTATVKVNGITVPSGAASGAIPLVVGPNTITTVVTAQDDVTTSTYSVTVTRLPSAVSTLSGLVLSSGTLSPAFSSTTTAYTASVANTTTSVTILPTVTDGTATVKVNGVPVPSGTTSQAITLVAGPNTVNVVVTAQDGTTSTYTVTVTRAPSAISTLSCLVLSSGTLSPIFVTATTGYAVTVTATSLTVTPTVTDATATVRINGSAVPPGAASDAVPMALGTNPVLIVVTAQDGITTSTYTVTVTRLSTVSSLSGLALNTGTLNPVFAPATTAYTASVANTTTSVTILPTVTDGTATVKVNGVPVPSGTTSQAITLVAGPNTVNVVVTAQDGTTSTYTVTVTRVYLDATFTSSATVPIRFPSYNATGNALNLSLAYAPPVGTKLTVVDNTGLNFITGQFFNLAQGQTVTLSYNNASYRFVVNYFGGTGNDLVLQWAYNKAYAWGSNIRGQLGENTINNSSLPVAVMSTGVLSGKTILSISAGSAHSLALCSDGTVAAWGYNYYGQLGNGTTTDSNVPVAIIQSGVLAGKTIIAVSIGYSHSLVLCSDGTVAAWGRNTDGQLGNGTTIDSNVPVLVPKTGVLTDKNVVAISAGYYHNIALCADGTVASWGRNNYGQLGNNSSGTNSSVPVNITTSGALNGKTAATLGAGSDHSLVLCLDGSIVTWGRNNNGQLGDGSNTNSPIPVDVDASDVLAGRIVKMIVAGGFHNLASCSDGTLVAFGRNTNGQLGNSGTVDANAPIAIALAPVLTGKTVVALQAANAHSLAICSDGSIASWGSGNNGLLGNGDTINSNVPVIVTTSGLGSGEKFVALASGSSASHSIALAAIPLSSSSALASLSLSAGTLSPVFSSGVTHYTATVATGTLTVTPAVTDAKSSVRVNGATVTSGASSGGILLTVGDNNISIAVTAEDGTQTPYTVTITRLGGNYEAWKDTAFKSVEDRGNPAISGWQATPANDGITNLMKYALVLDPITCGTGQLPSATPQDGYLTLTFRKNKQAVDLTYTVQASDTLADDNWGEAATVVSQTDEGDHWLVTVRDSVPQAGHPTRFMRLKVGN